MKAICIHNSNYLTKDKIYKIHHIYFNQVEILNDRGFYQYYPMNWFRFC